MSYEQPQIRDYGDLLDMTAATGAVGGEDGAGKSISVDANPIAQTTIQLLP